MSLVQRRQRRIYSPLPLHPRSEETGFCGYRVSSYKSEIAAAQNYFVVKAREAELQDAIPKAEFDAMQQNIADLKDRMLRLELENSMIEIAHGL